MSLRSSLAMGSVTPLTLAVMGALPSSPPREVWVTASSSCWTFSRMNTCQSGEKQVRGKPFTWQVIAVCHTGAIGVLVFVGVDTSEPETQRQNSSACLDSLMKRIFTVIPNVSLSCRWDFVWSWGQSSDPQSGRAVLHWPAWIWSGTRVPDICFLPGTEGTNCCLLILIDYYVIILSKGRVQRSEQLIIIIIIHYNKAKQDSTWGTDMK